LLFSLAAYAGAIALKEVVQTYTSGWVISQFGYVSLPTGIYLGAQTSIFEVGLAYLVARYAVSRRSMGAADAEGYGVALGFWENAVLLGALPLLNLALTYALIYEGLLPQSVYQNLVASNPSLFYPPGQLIVPIAFAVLERVSSSLAHFSWGYLCVFAVCFRRRAYALIALPMGLLDVLVPFAQTIPLWEFETIIFLLSSGFVLLAWNVTRADRKRGSVVSGPLAPQGAP
jgi:YhfC intramembrane metalloprotease